MKMYSIKYLKQITVKDSKYILGKFKMEINPNSDKDRIKEMEAQIEELKSKLRETSKLGLIACDDLIGEGVCPQHLY